MRGLNFDQLRALLEVIEQGSFSAAARRLNLTQPAVSLQIRELERRFGATLIERLGKQAHGLYLCVNHTWTNFGPKAGPRFEKVANAVALVLTFLCVVIAWVFFRADSIATALSVLSKMANPANVALGPTEFLYALLIAIYAAIVWFGPNTQTIMIALRDIILNRR